MYPPADDSADVYAPHILDATHSREGSGIRRLFFWWSYSKYPLNRRTFFSSLTMSTCAICTQTEPTLTALTWYVCMPLGIPTHPVLLFVLLCLCIVYRPFAIGHHSLRFLCTKHVYEPWSGPISWVQETLPLILLHNWLHARTKQNRSSVTYCWSIPIRARSKPYIQVACIYLEWRWTPWSWFSVYIRLCATPSRTAWLVFRAHTDSCWGIVYLTQCGSCTTGWDVKVVIPSSQKSWIGQVHVWCNINNTNVFYRQGISHQGYRVWSILLPSLPGYVYHPFALWQHSYHAVQMAWAIHHPFLGQ